MECAAGQPGGHNGDRALLGLPKPSKGVDSCSFKITQHARFAALVRTSWTRHTLTFCPPANKFGSKR